MQWSDAVFSLGSIVFVVALVPTLLGFTKPETSTSLTTGAVLLAFAVTYASMHLWYSAVMTFVLACCWLELALQRRRQERTVRAMHELVREAERLGLYDDEIT